MSFWVVWGVIKKLACNWYISKGISININSKHPESKSIEKETRTFEKKQYHSSIIRLCDYIKYDQLGIVKISVAEF